MLRDTPAAENILCAGCAYVGDKHSFPEPNDLIDVDPGNPWLKHYYCCSGDSALYGKDITAKGIVECDCFESL